MTAGPSPSANKKTKKSSGNTASIGKSNPSTSAATASFDLEATLCPICDEACTCPKTSTTVVVKSPKSAVKKSTSNVKKASVSTAIAKNSKKTDKPKYLNLNNNSKKKLQSYEFTDSSEYEDEYEGDGLSGSETKLVEDPALSFIRMIYSDEESLDEEEAYALYQATQLFSSSDEEEYEARGFTSKRLDGTDEEDDSDDYTTDSEEEDGEFEYTVVEYVQPVKKLSKKSAQFVAYDSDEGECSEENDEVEAVLSASLQDRLLLNAAANDHDEDMESCDGDEGFASSDSSSDDGNWLTYSVFDIDSDLPNLTGGIGGTSLSSHGSGTPDTLLFSTSSTDKIPNIAPQVLAAISAAAKHMAANNQNNGMGSSSSKYFSYITLKETAREDVNGEEFLFFEEGCSEESEEEEIEEDLEINAECESVEIEEIDCISSCDDSINSLDSLSDGGVVEEELEEDSFSDESSKKKKKRTHSIRKAPIIPVQAYASSTVSSDFMTSLNRWSRVPIGAFRRSRRPSIPSFHHNANPSTALKTFSTDPASLTLTPSPSHTANEDSFDESSANSHMPAEGQERSYSVVTWDELDLDIVPASGANAAALSSSPNNTHNWPLPKRSRSVISAPTNLANNFEWLNSSNWNWEI